MIRIFIVAVALLSTGCSALSATVGVGADLNARDSTGKYTGPGDNPVGLLEVNLDLGHNVGARWTHISSLGSKDHDPFDVVWLGYTFGGK